MSLLLLFIGLGRQPNIDFADASINIYWKEIFKKRNRLESIYYMKLIIYF